MLSGVKAQVGIKIYGDDLDLLRKKAEEVQNLMRVYPRHRFDDRTASYHPSTAHRTGSQPALAVRIEC